MNVAQMLSELSSVSEGFVTTDTVIVLIIKIWSSIRIEVGARMDWTRRHTMNLSTVLTVHSSI